jgi:hypothetical protein
MASGNDNRRATCKRRNHTNRINLLASITQGFCCRLGTGSKVSINVLIEFDVI